MALPCRRCPTSLLERRQLLRSAHRQARRYISTDPTQSIFLHRLKDEELEQSSANSSRRDLAAWRISVKDNICTRDMPTTCASRMLEGYTSPFDATVVRLLRNAGAHIVGKTNMDEFGMGSMNIDSAFGPVINPVTPLNGEDRVAGGSSGGAAASVAANMCRVALGSDTGGSVRLPAAYCGVYGFKPSYGLISRWGLVAYADSLDTVGIVARHSDDLKAVFDVLSHEDPKDPTSIFTSYREKAVQTVTASFKGQASSTKNLNGIRIGVPKEVFAEEVKQRVYGPLRQTLSTLKDLGAEIVSVSLPNTKYALSSYYVLASAEASSNLARFDGVRYGYRSTYQPNVAEGFADHIARTRSEAFGKEVQKRIKLGTYSLTSDYFDNYFLQAQRVRRLLRRDFDRAFCLENVLTKSTHASPDGVHAIVQPSAVDIAPTFSEAEQEHDALASYTQDILNAPASLSGLPAVSVPSGRVEGMPVGVTLITQWGCENVLWRILKCMGP